MVAADARASLDSQERHGNDDGVQIICAGLMRTGLKSLAEALRSLGYGEIYDRGDVYKTYPWWDVAIQNGATDGTFREMFDGYAVVLGMPVYVFWEQIHQAYPNAKIILTVRDEQEWFESVQAAKEQLDTEAPAAPLRSGTFLQFLERIMMPSYHKLCNVMRFAWSASLGVSFLSHRELNEVVTRSMYRKHNLYVQKSIPSDQLLVFNVREGWDPLCEFLGKPPPGKPFPAIHEVAYFVDERRVKSADAVIEDGMEHINRTMLTELRRGLAVTAAVLATLVAVVCTRLYYAGITWAWLSAALGCLAVHLSVSIWVAAKYVVQRVPLGLVIPSALGIVALSVGMNLVFLVYGILKEELVTVDHFPSMYIVVASRITSVGVALVGVWYTSLKQAPPSSPSNSQRSPSHRSPSNLQRMQVDQADQAAGESRMVQLLGAPLQTFAGFAIANDISTWAGYEMLKYVSFAVHIMARSASLLPSMVASRILSGHKHTVAEYCQALVLVTAVVFMQLEDEAGSKSPKKHQHTSAGAEEEAYGWLGMLCSERVRMGTFLLMVYFAMDSICSHYQSRAYKRNSKMSHYQMMLGGNLFAALTTSAVGCISTLVYGRPEAKVGAAGADGFSMGIMWKLLVLALSNALGQVLIYYAIKEYGPVIFQWIMTTRKVISVVFSLIWFRHPVTYRKFICIVVVFGLLVYQQLKPGKKKKAHGSGDQPLDRSMSFNIIPRASSLWNMFAGKAPVKQD
mmetsp:Transcript_10185/g.22368  ORF Transcript_10185/g.22368 Transcript_10185/m.22368 type:complete len:739 (+) Transcript_10185:50-2266(+)